MTEDDLDTAAAAIAALPAGPEIDLVERLRQIEPITGQIVRILLRDKDAQTGELATFYQLSFALTRLTTDVALSPARALACGEQIQKNNADFSENWPKGKVKAIAKWGKAMLGTTWDCVANAFAE